MQLNALSDAVRRSLQRALMPSLALVAVTAIAATQPLALHPANPHYFIFQKKPLIIVTSGEHYGAVLNLDFNYKKYLTTLASAGLNSTRTFSGAYCEPNGAFNISSNTLAPLSGRFISPWARSSVPGYANGGNKFDLSRWENAYFKRLKDFLSEAEKRGVIVELNLFCPFYEDSMWRLSPMNPINNVNEVGNVPRTNVYTLDKHGGLLAIQEEMTRKIVREVNKYDNLYFEICNEPYFGGVTREWQHHIADIITETENPLPKRHLISQNIANDKALVENPHPSVSIFNFHYANPPDTVAMNYHLNKVIGDNETGFRGTNDAPYRVEAWNFLVAGGGLFNHLDYSFVAGYEDGTFVYPASQPGGGNPTLRRQFRFLKETIDRLDLVNMRPMNEVLVSKLPAGLRARALGKPKEACLVYLHAPLRDPKQKDNPQISFGEKEIALEVQLPPQGYTITWLDTRQCRTVLSDRVHHPGGPLELRTPAFEQDIAVLIEVAQLKNLKSTR
jgi:hypothetical protein